MPRKIYCAYSTFFNILHIQSARTCSGAARSRKISGAEVREEGGEHRSRRENPRLSASQIVIYRNGRSESGLIHHDDFSPRRRKSSVTSIAIRSRFATYVARPPTLFRDKCTRHIYKILGVADWRDKQYANLARKLAQVKKRKLVQAEKSE